MVDDETEEIFFANGDGTRNLVVDPTDGCFERATRGLDVTMFPKRLSGYTLGSVDSARACAAATYDGRVVIRFPDLGSCAHPLERVFLRVYVYEAGSPLQICPMSSAAWTPETVGWADVDPIPDAAQAKCRNADALGFQNGKTGWQVIDVTSYVRSVQKGSANTGVVLVAVGLDGVGFFTKHHKDASLRPQVEIVYPGVSGLTWRIEGGNVGGLFAIDSATGQLSIARGGILDYEDIATQYFQIVVSATDGAGNVKFANMGVTTDDVNEAPTGQNPVYRLDENSAIQTKIGGPMELATDPDWAHRPAGKFAFSILEVLASKIDYVNDEELTASTAVSTEQFRIDASTGQIMLGMANVNREGDVNLFTVRVALTDRGVPRKRSVSVITVRVNDINEQPRMADQERFVSENSAVDAFVGKPLTIRDPDVGQGYTFTMEDNIYFKIEACSGQIQVKLTHFPAGHRRAGEYMLDYEAPGVKLGGLRFAVTVTDNGRNPDRLSDAATVSISLGDTPEAPEIFTSNIDVEEGIITGTPLGSRVTGRDVDAGQTETLQYSITRGNAGSCGDADKCPLFKIDPRTGQMYAAHAGAARWTIKTKGGRGTCTFSGAPFASALTSLQFGDINWQGVLGTNVRDPRFLGYYFASEDSKTTFDFRTYEENVAARHGGVGAKDTNLILDGEYVTSMTNPNGDSQNPADATDFEETKAYELTVAVTDTDKLTTEAPLRISIRDVNEPPVMGAGQKAVVAEGAAKGTKVGPPVAATDDDGSSQGFVFSLVGGSNGRFSIDAASGQITVDGDNDVTLLDTLVASTRNEGTRYVKQISQAGAQGAGLPLIDYNYAAFTVGRYEGTTATLGNHGTTSARLEFGPNPGPTGSLWRLRRLLGVGAWQVSEIAFFESSDCGSGEINTVAEEGDDLPRYFTISAADGSAAAEAAFDGDAGTTVDFDEASTTSAALGVQFGSGSGDATVTDDLTQVGSVLLHAPSSDGAMELVLETSLDGIKWVQVGRTLDNMGATRTAKGKCFAARRAGADLVTLDSVEMSSAVSGACKSAEVWYAKDTTPLFAEVASCAGSGDNADCVALSEGKPGTAWIGQGGASPWEATITLKEATDIDAVETWVAFGEEPTGFSGLAVDVYVGATKHENVYTSEKLWGGMDKQLGSATYSDVAEEFRWDAWNSHRFTTPRAGIKGATKVVLRFNEAKQTGVMRASLHQVRIMAAELSTYTWTNTGSTVTASAGSVVLRDLPYATLWQLRNFKSQSGSDTTSCVADIDIRGRDMGSRLSDCLRLHCAAAFPVGSKAHAEGKLAACLA